MNETNWSCNCGREVPFGRSCPTCGKNSRWLWLFWIPLIILACAVAGSWAVRAAAPQSVGASPYELEFLKRTQIQYQVLFKDLQKVMTEQTGMLQSVCGRSKLTVDQCDVNLETGAVTKKAPQPPGK
jgi:hypothetical protein